MWVDRYVGRYWMRPINTSVISQRSYALDINRTVNEEGCCKRAFSQRCLKVRFTIYFKYMEIFRIFNKL